MEATRVGPPGHRRGLRRRERHCRLPDVGVLVTYDGWYETLLLFQRELVEVNDAMDDASPENLKDLKLLAAPPWIDDEGGKLSQLCRRLT